MDGRQLRTVLANYVLRRTTGSADASPALRQELGDAVATTGPVVVEDQKWGYCVYIASITHATRPGSRDFQPVALYTPYALQQRLSMGIGDVTEYLTDLNIEHDSVPLRRAPEGGFFVYRYPGYADNTDTFLVFQHLGGNRWTMRRFNNDAERQLPFWDILAVLAEVIGELPTIPPPYQRQPRLLAAHEEV